MSDAFLDARVDWVAKKLRTAVRARLQPFGVEGHKFRLKPPLTEEQVAAFENRYSIELPADYRAFITRVANGGAGPAYGMYSLEQALTRERGLVPDDFLSTPFPHTSAYNPDEDPEVEAFWQRVERGEISEAEGERRHVYQTAGTLVLCHEGCGYLHFFVITGPARGQMWIDGRCSDQEFFPLEVGFLDWYDRWLDSTLMGGNGVWWMSDSEESLLPKPMRASRPIVRIMKRLMGFLLSLFFGFLLAAFTSGILLEKFDHEPSEFESTLLIVGWTIIVWLCIFRGRL